MMNINFSSLTDRINDAYRGVKGVTLDRFIEKRRLRRQANEAIDELVELTRDNLQLSPNRIRGYEDIRGLGADIINYEAGFGALEQGLKDEIRARYANFRGAQNRLSYSARRQLMESNPTLYHSLMAGAKGLGTLAAWQIFELTPDLIDKILDVPQFYIAAIAATTSLRQIPNRKVRIVLATLVPTVGGMMSYSDAVALVGGAASSMSSSLGQGITKILQNGKLLAFGLIGKYSLNVAAEKREIVSGRTVYTRPSEQYRSLDTGLNALIIYGGTKVFVEGSLDAFGAAKDIYNPMSHILAGVASYKYAVKSSKMPDSMKLAAKLTIPAVAAYFAVEGIGESLYKSSPTLKSTGKWLMEQGKYYSALGAAALTEVKRHFKIGYSRK